jgi:lipooligosaccharide transport system permease protein
MMLTSLAVAIAERRAGKLGDRYYAGRSRAVLQRSFIAFKSSMWLIVLSGFIEPVLYLFSFGYGVGKFVGNINLGDGRMVSYAAFIAPGLLATSAMNGAIYDSTWNVFEKMHESRLYHGMLATSLGPLDVALGEIAWAMLRGLVYAIGFMVVVVPLGLIPSWWGILAIPAAVLIALGLASIGMAITSYFTSYQQMNVIQIAMMPMFLFSGSFFPINVFPRWVQTIIEIFPLWQAIQMIRGLTLGVVNIGLLGHVAYFLVLITSGLYFTTKRLDALFMR